MTVLLYFMYRIWLLLPVDHINLLQIVPGSFYTPTPGAGVFHFPLSPGSFLLFLLLRTPNIVCDMSLAVIIYKFALRLSGSAKAAGSASAFWLINPFGTLIAEMWANFDIIFALFLTLGVYSLFRRRLFWSATFLALSVGVRFWSILLLPFVLSVLESEFHADRHPLLLSRNSLVFAASSIILSVVAISPFLISMLLGDAPRSIIYSDAPDVSFFLGLPLRLYDYIILPLIAALVIYLFILYDVWKPRFREIHIVILGFLLIFFALARWQGQWFLWALPFLALDFGTRRKGRKYATLFMVTILPLVIVQEGFYFSTWGNSFFFIPNFNPNLIALSRQLFLLLYDPGVITFRLPSLLESTLVGLSVAYFLGLYRDSRSQKVHPDGNSHEKT